jgi:CTP synthase
MPAAILGRAREGDVVVPVASGIVQATYRDVLQAAVAAGIAVEHVLVDGRPGRHRLVDATRQTSAVMPLPMRDRFGRLEPVGQRPGPLPGHRVCVAVVGSETDHRDVNPATLAALGDAADAAGLVLDVVFIPPAEATDDRVASLIADVEGIVLPGGASMANVPGQIRIAEAALRAGTPTVGLCLGMQTMTTAVIRRELRRADANLAEVDPHAAVKTFVPLVGEEPDRHRVGEQAIVTAAGSRLYALLGPKGTIRSNHRYKLNSELIGTLQSAGLAVTARDTSGAIAEGVELSGHPFFVGMQGHPELKSRSGAPHPLLKAFLEAVASRRR